MCCPSTPILARLKRSSGDQCQSDCPVPELGSERRAPDARDSSEPLVETGGGPLSGPLWILFHVSHASLGGTRWTRLRHMRRLTGSPVCGTTTTCSCLLARDHNMLWSSSCRGIASARKTPRRSRRGTVRQRGVDAARRRRWDPGRRLYALVSWLVSRTPMLESANGATSHRRPIGADVLSEILGPECQFPLDRGLAGTRKQPGGDDDLTDPTENGIPDQVLLRVPPEDPWRRRDVLESLRSLAHRVSGRCSVTVGDRADHGGELASAHSPPVDEHRERAIAGPGMHHPRDEHVSPPPVGLPLRVDRRHVVGPEGSGLLDAPNDEHGRRQPLLSARTELPQFEVARTLLIKGRVERGAK
jgi:hypothetical protein